MTNTSAVERPASPSSQPETPHDDLVEPAPRGAAQRRYLAGATGVHIGGATCRAAVGFEDGQIARLPLPAGVATICDTIVAADLPPV